MIHTIELYLPTRRRKVKIDIYVPKYFKKKSGYDTLYMLDGQNAFIDSRATFKRSLRAHQHLEAIQSTKNRQIIGVAIYNTNTDMGRINEYTPFELSSFAKDAWKKQKLSFCHHFCEDVIHTIIPYIEEQYGPSQNRWIYGSSLAALTAIYLGYHYEAFAGIGAFSTASFLCPKEFDDFIQQECKPTVKLFLYVGKKEISDDHYDETLYYNTSVHLLQTIQKSSGMVQLAVSETGTHCEAAWEAYFDEFLSYLYQ